MYCPKCATQNLEDARYCRSCGVNLSLVPQALTGQLPEDPSAKHHPWQHRRGHPGGLGEGIQKLFMGMGFLILAITLGFFGRGRGWWYWLLIPAFGLLGKGVAEIVVAKQQLKSAPQQHTPIPPNPTSSVRAPNTGELSPPPSVTEGTTKLFDEAEQRR